MYGTLSASVRGTARAVPAILLLVLLPGCISVEERQRINKLYVIFGTEQDTAQVVQAKSNVLAKPVKAFFNVYRGLLDQLPPEAAIPFLRTRPAFLRLPVVNLLEDLQAGEPVTRGRVVETMPRGEEGFIDMGPPGEAAFRTTYRKVSAISRELAFGSGYPELSVTQPRGVKQLSEGLIYVDEAGKRADALFFFFFNRSSLLEAVVILPVDDLSELFRRRDFCASFLRIVRGEWMTDGNAVLDMVEEFPLKTQNIVRYDRDPIVPGYSLDVFAKYCEFLDKAKKGGRCLPISIPRNLPSELLKKVNGIKHGYAEVRTFIKGKSSFALYFVRDTQANTYTFMGLDYLPERRGAYPLAKLFLPSGYSAIESTIVESVAQEPVPESDEEKPGVLFWLAELIPDLVVSAKELLGESLKSPFSFAEGVPPRVLG